MALGFLDSPHLTFCEVKSAVTNNILGNMYYHNKRDTLITGKGSRRPRYLSMSLNPTRDGEGPSRSSGFKVWYFRQETVLRDKSSQDDRSTCVTFNIIIVYINHCLRISQAKTIEISPSPPPPSKIKVILDDRSQNNKQLNFMSILPEWYSNVLSWIFQVSLQTPWSRHIPAKLQILPLSL